MADTIDAVEQLFIDQFRKNVFNDENTYLDFVQNGAKSPILDRGAPSEANINKNLYDNRVGNEFAPIAGNVPLGAGNQIDVFATAHWLRNISTEFGILEGNDPSRSRAARVAKFATFSGLTLLMGTMNPGDLELGGTLNQIFNPLSFVLSAVPFLNSTTLSSPNLAAAASITGDVYESAFKALQAASKERILDMRDGTYLKATNLSDISKFTLPTPGFYGDLAKPGQGDTLQKPGTFGFGTSIANQVDNKSPIKGLYHTNLYGPDSPYGDNGEGALLPLEKLEAKKSVLSQAALKVNTLFLPRKFPGGRASANREATTWIANRVNQSDIGIKTKGSAMPSNVDIRVHVNEDPNTGLVPADKIIPENEMYMPFCFQDLRKDINQFLYFRAFIKGTISETFTPEWQIERYYGRVDQIPIYMGTGRTVSLTFDVVAWSMDDLEPMYQKLHKLQSMVYPMFDTAGFMQAAPIIRMRVGDLISAKSKKGLPGYLTSLDFSYDDGIWNLETDFKVPRKVSVALSFNVLHEANPGIYPGVEGGSPRFGVATEDPNTPGELHASEADVRGVAVSSDILKDL